MQTFFQVLSSKRMLVMILFGFSSGLPLALTGSTLQAWMQDSSIDIKVIGVFSLLSLPYTVKYLWSPFVDRFQLKFLGRRRGWLFLFQLLLMSSIFFMALQNPTSQILPLAIAALLVAFFSASQDIVIDAYRAEILPKEEYGLGASVYILGYRLAMLTSGALALILADHFSSWKSVYFFMGSLMVIGCLTTLWANEPHLKAAPPKTIRESILFPFLDFFKRRGAIEVLLFIILYKLGDALAGALTTPFLMQLGYSKTIIGSVTKTVGVGATIVGTLVGGALLLRWSQKKALLLFGLLQAVSNLVFTALAHFVDVPKVFHNSAELIEQSVSTHTPTLVAAIAIENLCGGMGTAAFTAFLMSLCNHRFTTSQYALLTSFMAITRTVLVSRSGFWIHDLGWESYYLMSAIAALPALLMLARYSSWNGSRNDEEDLENAKIPTYNYAFAVISFIALFSYGGYQIFAALS